MNEPTIESQMQESNVEVNNPPDIDRELDTALENHFKEPPKEEIKNESKTEKTESKPQEVIQEAPKKDANKEQLSNSKNGDVPKEDSGKLLAADEADAINQKDKGSWGILKNNYKRSLNDIKQREDEIVKLKTSLAEKEAIKQKEIEALKSEKEDLSRYRAMVDIQSDPEFVSKFDQPIEKASSSIKEMLLKMNVDQTTIDQLDLSNTKLMDEIIGHVGQHRDNFVAKKLRQKVEELIDLTDKRNETLTEQKNNYKELLETKKKESFSRGAEEEGRMVKHLENITLSKDKDGNSIFPFLNKIEVKEGAGQPEVDQTNNHNKMVDMMNDKVKEALKQNTPEGRTEVAVAAAAAHYMNHQIKSYQAKIKNLEEQLSKISNVTSETEKVKRNGNIKHEKLYEIDSDTAIAEHFGRR